MGIFGKKEQIDLSEPGEVTIADHVAAAVPDAGEYFLNSLTDFCNEQMYARLKADIDSRRAPNGWLIGNGFSDVPPVGRKQTPLTFLSLLVGTARDASVISVWGTSANRGKDYNTLATTLRNLVDTQGHAAAATWAIIARPEGRFNLEYLSEALQRSWGETFGLLRNKDVIKAFKNWNK
ncbi:hypothetical protein [Actinomadura geliboluensis]|uniref:hypothetical protein n=1 Tax=Actinomadura geliboluensis TaxID=882440 RepID=UPI00371ABCC6